MRQASTAKKTPVKRTTTVKSRAPRNRFETPLDQTAYTPENLYQKIQETAYQLYCARGCVHGFDVEDWLAAEQIVKGE